MEGLIRRRKKGMIKPIQVSSGNQGEVKEDEEPLSPGSVIYHKGFNLHILAIIGFKTPIDVDVFKDKLPLTLLKHPRFSSVVVEDPSNGELKWVRTTQVDIEKHIIVPKIDLNKIESSDKFVDDYIHNLSKTALDKSRPLWEFHILNLKTSKVESEGIGIFRIHHSLGDGISLISLLIALTRKSSDPQALPTIPTQKKRDKMSPQNGPKLGLFWWWVLKLVYNTIIDVTMFMATAFFLKDTETPIKGGHGLASTPKKIVYKMVSLDDIKLVKNAMNVTVNDVALGITQAGLSWYLNGRYGASARDHVGEAEEERNNLPKNIRLRSILLVNIRPSGGIQVLADMMEKNTEAKWGNSLGYVLLPFTIGLHDDPLDYIREAKATADRKKHSLESWFSFSVGEVVKKLLGAKVAGALPCCLNSHTTMSFSNLAGPLEEIEFYGHPLAFVAPSCYGQSQALMIHFQSYADKMMIVASVDEATICDPHKLCDDIAKSLDIVKEAVMSRGLVKAT